MSQNLTLKAEFPAYGGLTIARHEGKVVMIKGAVPGETVEVVITKEKKDYSEATVMNVVEPSESRVAPACPHFGRCGGCQLQFMDYAEQVRTKQEVLVGNLRRIGKMEVELAPPIIGQPLNYRRRGQFKVAGKKVGFFGEKSHDVIDIENCPLMSDKMNDAYAKARGLIKASRVSIEELHISVGEDGPGALIIASAGSGADYAAFSKELQGMGFLGIFIQQGLRLQRFGDEFITLNLLGLKYTISPMSFFQSNWRLNTELVKLIRETLNPLEGKKVLDLYAGAGNFSLPLAANAGSVIAVEENPNAIKDGKRNRYENSVTNCMFIKSSVLDLSEDEKVDILVTDPPRTGLDAEVTQKVLSIMPERIAYVSCNPSTFARDYSRLSARYAVDSVRMIDFFPQTYHIESVAFLRAR